MPSTMLRALNAPPNLLSYKAHGKVRKGERGPTEMVRKSKRNGALQFGRKVNEK